MLQAHRIEITFPGALSPLLQDLTFAVLPGDKVGLIGANGSGKSTLLDVMEGRVMPSAGNVVRESGLRVARLPQDLMAHAKPWVTGGRVTVGELVRRSYPDAWEGSLRRWNSFLGAGHLEDLPYDQASLGERTRAMLAGILATESHVVLLDEPTNHLDVASRELIEQALSQTSAAVVMACHDRTTLDAVCDRIWELENGRMTIYAGGFTEAKERKERQAEADRARREVERREVRRLKSAAETMRQRAQNVTKKPGDPGYSPAAKPFYNAKERRMHVQAANMRKRVSRAEAAVTEKPYEPDATAFDFPTRTLFGAAVTLEQVSFRYPDGEMLFQCVSGTIGPGDRIALVGPNGAGKTTLLRLVMGALRLASGRIQWNPRLEPAYLSQDRHIVDGDLTLDALLHARLGSEAGKARSLLGRLGLRGRDGHTLVRCLSMGEKTKVELTLATLAGANLLLLDEPTNHLDQPSIEALGAALMEYPGGVLFTSHDRRFVEEIATQVWNLERGKGV